MSKIEYTDQSPEPRRRYSHSDVVKRRRSVARWVVALGGTGLGLSLLLSGPGAPTDNGKEATITLSAGLPEDGVIRSLTQFQGQEPNVEHVSAVLAAISGIQEEDYPGPVVNTKYGNEPEITQDEVLRGVPVSDTTPTGDHTVRVGTGSFDISVK